MYFGQVGSVIDAEIQYGRDGRSFGFGVVQFDSNPAALAAISKFNETDLDGRIIFVREDRGTRSPKPVGSRVAAPKAYERMNNFINGLGSPSRLR